MSKANGCGFLGGLIGVGLMSLSTLTLAADDRMQGLLEASKQGFANNNLPSAHDILSDNDTPAAALTPNRDAQPQPIQNDSEAKDAENNPLDNSDNDAANDYDSNKESASEETAPTPQEEEDNPLLDEEGNVANAGRRDQGNQQRMLDQQNLMNPLTQPNMPSQDLDNADNS